MLLKVLKLVTLVIATLNLTLTQALFPEYQAGFATQESQYLARCTSSNQPCRLKFEILDAPNGLIQQASSQQCSCNSYQGACSNDWTRSDRVISRNLRSETMNISLQMMFCSAVTPVQACSSNQIALEVSGSLMIPNTLDNYACRCDDGQPLYLVQRRTQNFNFYHKYVCASSWRTCQASDPCMTVRASTTDYHCRCRSDQVCSHSTWRHNTVESAVYCSSR